MSNIATITDTQDNTIYFGFTLKRIKSNNPDKYIRDVYAEHQKKISAFIKILHRESSKITYCLRTVISPYKPSKETNSVTIGLIVKLPIESIDEIENLSKTLKILLHSSFSDHHWQEIITTDTLENLLNPLDWNKTWNVEIRRKSESIALNSYLPSHAIGFLDETISQDKNLKCIKFIHPYVQNYGGFEKLLKTMISYQKPIVLTAILSPTKLTQFEIDDLQEQIELCEGTVNHAGKSLQITRSRANFLTESLTSKFFQLQDSPFLLSFHISSEKALDSLLLENAGLALTNPSGLGAHTSGNGNSTDILLGGYEIVSPKSDEENRTFGQSLRQLSYNDYSEQCINNRLSNIVGASEAATAFYFPCNADGNLPGIEVFAVNEHPLPKELIDLSTAEKTKTCIGTNNYYGFNQEVLLDEMTRRQHTYIVGQTGTGKTTLLKTMIESDMKAGRGLIVIDPHGELYHDLLSLVPENRINDVILFDPADFMFPVGMNLLEVKEDEDRDFLLKELRAILKRFIAEHFSMNDGSYSGPVFYQHVMNNMLLAMSDSNNPGTIIEFYNIFQSDSFWKRWLPLKWENGILRNWVDEVLPNVDYNQIDRTNGTRHGDYFSSKFLDFVNDSRVRNIFGQPHSTVDFSNAMAENKIVFVNLSKGLLGEANASFLGMILLAKITAALMGRAKEISEGKKMKPYYLYVDEFQNIATENFSILLSEARKFGLGLVLANQFLAQVSDLKIKNALLGNVGTIIAFRLGLEDSQLLASQFQPNFGHFELTNLPNYMAVMRTNVNGERVIPATLRTIKPAINPQSSHRQTMVESSRIKYGTPKRFAEKMIEVSLQPKRISTIYFHSNNLNVTSNEMIGNIDFKRLIFDLFQPIQETSERLCKQGINEMFVYLVNNCKLPRQRLWKILDKLTNITPQQLILSEITIDQRLRTLANRDLRQELDAIRIHKRELLVDYWKEWISDNFTDKQSIQKLEEIEKCIGEHRWVTAISKLQEFSNSKLSMNEPRQRFIEEFTVDWSDRID